MPTMSSGHLLFEKTGQAPSPSKDFHQLLVTNTEVKWRTWKISLRKDQINIPPSQKRVSHEDFRYDTIIPADISRVFGPDILHYVQGLVFGDWLIRIPEALVIKIASYLDLLDIARLAQVCKFLRQVCLADKLWEILYIKHSGKVTYEMREVAEEMGWKKMFFSNKLQIQKEVSRLRRSAELKKRKVEDRDVDPAFLTEQMNH